MARKLTHAQKRPHAVVLPKSAMSPTGSIYKRYDIVSQGRVLWSDDSRTVRSSEPFVLKIKAGSRVRVIASKLTASK